MLIAPYSSSWSSQNSTSNVSVSRNAETSFWNAFFSAMAPNAGFCSGRSHEMRLWGLGELQYLRSSAASVVISRHA